MSKRLYHLCILCCLLLLGALPPVNARSFSLSLDSKFANEDLQAKEVRGTVRDSTGVLPGVSITVKNQSSIGTTTDLNGKYILDVPGEDAILVFTIVGYETQEIPVRGRE